MKRRLLAPVTVSFVLVSMLVVFSGCGDDTGKAKEYMKKADDIIRSMETGSQKLGSTLQSILTDVVAGEPATSAKADEMAKKLSSAAVSPVEQAKEARAEYKKMMALNKVEDYRKYAELRIKQIDNIIEIVESTGGFLFYMRDTLRASESGRAINTDEVQKRRSDFLTGVGSIAEKADKIGGRAEDIKKEKNL